MHAVVELKKAQLAAVCRPFGVRRLEVFGSAARDDFDEAHSDLDQQTENIGEALAQLAKPDPELAARVPEYRQIIGFRNVLVHGYATLNHDEAWRAIAESLPPLQSTANALLAGRGAEDLS